MAKKILIIDDDPDIVDAMKLVLETRGYAIDYAYDGEEGMKKAKAILPDLIILDVMMETIDEGFHVSYKLKEDPKLAKIPVLMATAIGQVTKFKFDKERDRDFMPVEEFVEKPVKPDVLIKTVERLLAE
jgi:CheY-like chemotaxis protein